MTTAKAIAEQFERHGNWHLQGLIPQQVVADLRGFLMAEVAKRYAPAHKLSHVDNPVSGLVDVTYTVPISKVLKASGILDALLGPQVFLRLPPGARAVHPNHAEGLGPPHQDGARLRDLDNFVTIWVPLVEIDESCGGLGLYPTLGHAGEIPEGERGIDVGDTPVVPVHMSPGDVLIFHKWMPHVSMPNTSDRVRYSMDLRYYSSLHEMKKEALDCQTWQPVHPPK